VENIALFPSSVTRLAVNVSIPHPDTRHGDQAGILLYSSDSQWVKLVIEGGKARGSRMVVLALMPSNADDLARGAEPQAMVSKKWLLESDAPKTMRLQLELKRGESCCSVIASFDGNDAVELPVPIDCARLGIMGHLSEAQPPFPRQHWFHFSDFCSA
jgi:regulation of enolase protein 1 (concanavalin A-like superfamily)